MIHIFYRLKNGEFPNMFRVSSSQTLKFAEGTVTIVTLRDRPEDSQDLPGTREQLVVGGPQSTQLEASGRFGQFSLPFHIFGCIPTWGMNWIYMMIYYV